MYVGQDKLFHGKFLARDATGTLRIWRRHLPVTFWRLRQNDFLDTSDLMLLFEVSRPTLARYLSLQWGLEPSRRVGGALLFRKQAVLAWWRRMKDEKTKWRLKGQLERR